MNLSSQVLHNCKAIRPSAVADSGDDTTNCVSNWFVTQAVVFLAISGVSNTRLCFKPMKTFIR